MNETEQIELTPENFCYLSNCQFFRSDINSTGCLMDYMHDEELDGLCPLDMERSVREDDPKWQPCKKAIVEKLREITDDFARDRELMEKMGRDAFCEALQRCAELEQKVFDARIQYERLLYALQEMKKNCFGEIEKEKK